jgi:hypothetical protein
LASSRAFSCKLYVPFYHHFAIVNVMCILVVAIVCLYFVIILSIEQ